MKTIIDLPNIFHYAKETFASMIKEFEDFGLEISAGLELRQGSGMLCYYDLGDGHIYLSLPNPDEPGGKLKLLFMRSLLNCDNNDEFTHFIYLFIPRLLAHELGHYYRHHYQKFGQNLWLEEQIANQLASAVTKHRFSPTDKAFILDFLDSALEGLAKKMDDKGILIDSYYSQLHALNVAGDLNTSTMDKIILMDKLFSLQPEQMLKDTLSKEIVEQLDKRQNVIDEFNTEYTSDVMKYFYYQLGWLKLDLESRERHYVEEFAKIHLNISDELLPMVKVETLTTQQILALYKGYKIASPLSQTLGRYFYKRYRSALLNQLNTDVLHEAATPILSHWDEELDTLNLMTNLAPKELLPLFPQNIAKTAEDFTGDIEAIMATETDRQLLRFCTEKTQSELSSNTLKRLYILEKIELFSALPAEVIMELAHQLIRMEIAKGEPVIWQGTYNDDIFILTRGKLEVLVEQGDGDILNVSEFTADENDDSGVIFGEMSFFTRRSRTATVKAVEPSECLVLKASELKIIAFKNPYVLMEMGKVLAERLQHMSQG